MKMAQQVQSIEDLFKLTPEELLNTLQRIIPPQVVNKQSQSNTPKKTNHEQAPQRLPD